MISFHVSEIQTPYTKNFCVLLNIEAIPCGVALFHSRVFDRCFFITSQRTFINVNIIRTEASQKKILALAEKSLNAEMKNP